MRKINDAKNILERFYTKTGPERCGFILPDDKVFEVPNMCNQPNDGFLVSTAHIREYVETLKAVASWHTHPNKDANLSGEDYRAFRAYPHMCHFVIGADGVRCYKYDPERKAILEVTDPTI